MNLYRFECTFDQVSYWSCCVSLGKGSNKAPNKLQIYALQHNRNSQNRQHVTRAKCPRFKWPAENSNVKSVYTAVRASVMKAFFVFYVYTYDLPYSYFLIMRNYVAHSKIFAHKNISPEGLSTSLSWLAALQRATGITILFVSPTRILAHGAIWRSLNY